MLKVGDTIPAITLKQMTAEGPTDVLLAQYCAGRKVVIFALPGAFTPTCSESHVPSYIENAKALRDKGVEAVACISTADFFVMNAWGKSMGVGADVDMIADGSLADSQQGHAGGAEAPAQVTCVVCVFVGVA